MNTKRFYLVGFSITIVSLVLMGLFQFLDVELGQAVSTIRYVAQDNTCGGKDPCYTNIQAAVDAAQAGDEILIAGGIYTGVNHASGLAQMAVITKTVTLRGGYATDDWEHSLPITRPTILNAQNAGRVFYISGLISPTIENLRVVNGNAAGLGGTRRFAGYSAGGGMYVISATVLLSNTLFEGNQADVGGGIYAENSPFSLLSSTILSNESNLGGGVFLEGSNSTLGENIIVLNTSGYGGGLAAYGGWAELSHNRINNNFSSLHGGGVIYVGADGFLISNVITGNNGGPGGGISLSGNILVFDNTISQNSGSFGAGIAVFDGNISLVGNTISDNQSNDMGGGVSLWYWSNSGDPDQKILADNIISGNTATSGGGLVLQFVRPALFHNQIVGNHAVEQGGGIYSNNSEIHMDGDRVVNNTAEQNGGGIAIQGQGNLTSSNLVIADNQSALEGSAIFAQDTSVDLAQATIANNSGSSGILILSEVSGEFVHSLVTMTNAIIAGHTTGITASQGSTVTINGILWFDNQTNTDGLGTYLITNTVAGDPAFTSDYHISELSAAVDTGVPSGVFLDIDMDPRPYNKYDLGADEFWPLGILKRSFLPVIFR